MSQNLERHELALPFRPLLEELERNEINLKKQEERVLVLTKLLDKTQKQLATLAPQEADCQEELKRKEQQLKAWLPQLELVSEQDSQLNELAQKLKELEQKQTQTAQRVAQYKKESSQLAEKQEKEQRIKNKTEAYLQKNQRLEHIKQKTSDWSVRLNRWESSSKLLASLNEKHNKQLDERKKIEKEFLVKQQELAKAELKQQALLVVLNTLNNQLKNTNLEQLVDAQQACAKEQLRAGDLLKLAQQHQEQQLLQKRIAKELKQQQVACSEQANQLNLLQQKIPLAEQALLDAEKLLDLERGIKGFEQERKKLASGQPCKLCGSTHHPYVEKYAHIELDSSEATVLERKNQLKQLQKAERQLALQHSTAQTRLEALQQDGHKLNQELERTLNDFQEIEPHVQIHERDTLTKAAAQWQAKQNELQLKIKQVQAWQREKEHEEKKYQRIQQEQANCKNACTRLEEQGKSLSAQLSDLLAQKETEAETVTNIHRDLEAELMAYAWTMPALGAVNAFIQQVEEDADRYQRGKESLQKTMHQLDALQKDANNLRTLQQKEADELLLLNEQQQKTQQQQQRLRQSRAAVLALDVSPRQHSDKLQSQRDAQQEQLTQITKQAEGLKNQLIAQQQELKAGSEAKNNSNEELENAQKQLAEKLTQTAFVNREDLKKAILKEEQEKQIRAQRTAWQEKATGHEALLKKLQADTQEHNANCPKGVVEQELKQQIAASKDAREKCLRRLGEIENTFAQNVLIIARNQSLVAAIQQQEKELAKWRKLMALLGGSKDAFNTYVQRLTLVKLIHLANVHLYKLNKRYSLYIKDTYAKGEELNFMLVDHFQTDQKRLVDTASGGEKFLISLALALGLSDLASKNVSIGSLFIDEGFGTLDNDTLELVIATLETLRKQGKLIGIISHVSSLKDRIATQIQVHKRNNGSSVLELI